jgi:hypothetical protein
MSIATSTAKIQYTLAATVQALPIPFYFLESGHIKAIRSRADVTDYVMVLGTDYTLTGVADEDGGELTTIATNMQVGDVITIKRDIAITQTVNYVYNDRFPAETHERALDKLTMIVQQLKEVTDRAVQFPESDVAGTGNIMPSAADRAAKIFGFDASGAQVQLYDPVSAVFAEGDAIYANTVAALKAVLVAPLLNGQQCHVAGYSSPGDGGGGTWVYLTASATTADVGTVVAPNAGAGRWHRIYSGPINPIWFGAIGDGVADDSTALALAFTCLTNKGGGTLLLPKGSWTHASTLQMSDNTILAGEGLNSILVATFVNTALSVDEVTIYLGNSCVIRDLQLKQAIAAGTRKSNQEAHMISGVGKTNILLDGVTITNGPGAGILFNSGSNIRIRSCYVTGTKADGIHFSNGCFRMAVTNCIVHAVGDDGIAVVSYDLGPAQQTDWSITNNVVTDGVGRGITCIGSAKGTIVGNRIKNCLGGIYVVYEASYTTFAPKEIVVSGNCLDTCGTVNGLHPLRISACLGITVTGNLFQNCRNIVVDDDGGATATKNLVFSDNVIQNNIDDGQAAILVQDTTDFSITNNVFKTIKKHAINCNGAGCTRGTISGNTIIDAWTITTAAFADIDIVACTYIVGEGNVCRGSGSTYGADVRIATTFTGNRVNTLTQPANYEEDLVQFTGVSYAFITLAKPNLIMDLVFQANPDNNIGIVKRFVLQYSTAGVPAGWTSVATSGNYRLLSEDASVAASNTNPEGAHTIVAAANKVTVTFNFSTTGLGRIRFTGTSSPS